MEILLRKASTLSKAASAAASKIELEATLKLSSHTLKTDTNFSALLDKASFTLSERLTSVLDLHDAASTIRALAKVANAKQVDGLLNEKNALDVLEKTIATVLDAITKGGQRNRYGLDETIRVEHNADAVKTAYMNIRERAATMTSGTLPMIELPAITETTVKHFETRLASLRRRRANLMDELAAANLNERIRLPDKVVTVLRKHGIIE